MLNFTITHLNGELLQRNEELGATVLGYSTSNPDRRNGGAEIFNELNQVAIHPPRIRFCEVNRISAPSNLPNCSSGTTRQRVMFQVLFV